MSAAVDRLSLFPGTEPHLCFVFFSYHYYIFVAYSVYFCRDDQSSHAHPQMKEAAPNCHSADSLEPSLIKSEISQSEECLRSWELGPADNLPGI